MQRTAFGTGFEFRCEGAFEIEMNTPSLATINNKQIMTSASSSPTNNAYVVLAPTGTITHDAVNPITFNASVTTQSPQWTLQAAGAGFNLLVPGLYLFTWGYNNNGANSSFFQAHLINAVQYITEQWATSATPLAGVQDSHVWTYVYVKTTSVSESHTFTIAGATAADANTTLGTIGVNITFLPMASTFAPH